SCPLGTLTLRIEGDQLAGELVGARTRAALDVVPGLAAQLRECGRMPVGADIARHLPDLLVRDVQPVVTAEGEKEIVARDARDGLRLEAEKLSDAVVLVDDEVARAQVGEALQSAADPRVGSRRTLAEDLRVREEDEPEVAQDEAAPRGGDGEEKPFSVRKFAARLEDFRLDAAEECLGAQGFAAMREGDDDAVPSPDKGKEIALGF